jgi:SET domain-containing protein
MHFLTLRERGSKIYSETVYNIPMNNDRSHINMSSSKVEETKVVQERRQIDKIMHGIIKERLFSHFIDEDTRLSEDNYSKITGICKKGYFQGRFRHKPTPIPNISKTIEVNSSRKMGHEKR